LNSRIAAVPFTLRNLREDLADVGSNFDGAPDLEFRLANKALELEQSGLSYRVLLANPTYSDATWSERVGGKSRRKGESRSDFIRRLLLR
jgi:hypothetical protein